MLLFTFKSGVEMMCMRWVTGFWMLVLVMTVNSSSLDPFWIFNDGESVYSSFQYCDTNRQLNLLCQSTEYNELPDTGGIDGIYIDFNYTFAESLIVTNRTGTEVIYKDYRAGFAGFKTAWDYGMVGFLLARYKSLVFSYKGPNPNHKVTIAAWYNNGDCGAESYREVIGTFAPSAEWQEITIPIPQAFESKIDSIRNGSLYFEFVFLINHSDPNNLAPGESGNLKIDNMRLVGRNPIDHSPASKTVLENQPCTLSVVTSTNVATDVHTYQWVKDGVPVAGATSAEYIIPNTQLEQAGQYVATVTVNSSLSFNSLPATVAVTDDPNITPGMVAAEESSGCGCGSGTGLALLPPIFIKVMSRRKKKVKK
jgi:hypothetical protein